METRTKLLIGAGLVLTGWFGKCAWDSVQEEYDEADREARLKKRVQKLYEKYEIGGHLEPKDRSICAEFFYGADSDDGDDDYGDKPKKSKSKSKPNKASKKSSASEKSEVAVVTIDVTPEADKAKDKSKKAAEESKKKAKKKA